MHPLEFLANILLSVLLIVFAFFIINWGLSPKKKPDFNLDKTLELKYKLYQEFLNVSKFPVEELDFFRLNVETMRLFLQVASKGKIGWHEFIQIQFSISQDTSNPQQLHLIDQIGIVRILNRDRLNSSHITSNRFFKTFFS